MDSWITIKVTFCYWCAFTCHARTKAHIRINSRASTDNDVTTRRKTQFDEASGGLKLSSESSSRA